LNHFISAVFSHLVHADLLTACTLTELQPGSGFSFENPLMSVQ